ASRSIASPNVWILAPPCFCASVSPTGKPATASPYSLIRSPQAQIGGRVVPVAFAGMTPGFTGLMQINLQVPADAPTGSDVPLQLSVNGMTAQAYLGGAPTAALTIAIK